MHEKEPSVSTESATSANTAAATHQAIDAVWRIESARIIGALTRIVRDVGLAEEFAQDALVAALQQWPGSGVPDNPGAWLMATAKHRALDHFRRTKLLERKHEEIGRELNSQQESAVANYEAEFDAANQQDFGDDLLRLLFISCHPVLSTEARVALTLRLLGGLTTQEIARAFREEPDRIVTNARAIREHVTQTLNESKPGSVSAVPPRFCKTTVSST